MMAAIPGVREESWRSSLMVTVQSQPQVDEHRDQDPGRQPADVVDGEGVEPAQAGQTDPDVAEPDLGRGRPPRR